MIPPLILYFNFCHHVYHIRSLIYISLNRIKKDILSIEVNSQYAKQQPFLNPCSYYMFLKTNILNNMQELIYNQNKGQQIETLLEILKKRRIKTGKGNNKNSNGEISPAVATSSNWPFQRKELVNKSSEHWAALPGPA